MIRFSVIIPTYNRSELLKQAVEAVIAQTYPHYDVTVVDDGSTDRTAKMMSTDLPMVQFIRQHKNGGPARARNKGIESTSGEIVVFVDDDCVMPPDFLSSLADGYLRYPQVAGIGGYQEPPQAVIESNILARYESYQTHVIYNVGKIEVLGGFECPAGGTNSMSYRRSVLEEVGMFDTTFPVAAGEDAYIKHQVTQNGHQLLFMPLKVVHHQRYDWGPFWGQQKRRGIGEVYFQSKVDGSPPTRLKVGARLIKRTLRYFPNLIRLGPPLATVELIAGWASIQGQFEALNMHGQLFKQQEQTS